MRSEQQPRPATAAAPARVSAAPARVSAASARVSAAGTMAAAPGLVCAGRPDPGCGDSPACWVTTATSRQRLEHACAVLRRYGVAACPALGAHPEVTRHWLRSAILDEFPDGVGSYLFWTLPEDQAGFRPDGAFAGPLTVYLSGPSIERAVFATLDLVGLTAVGGPGPDTLLVSAATDGQSGHGHGGTLSPASQTASLDTRYR